MGERRPDVPAQGTARTDRFGGPCRFQMAETTCQPQFEPPHHLEWLIRRLSASSIWARLPFFGERAVRPWRRVLWFRRAPPGPSQRAFARGWAGSRYRAEKGRGGGVLYKGLSNPSLWQLVIANPLVATAPRSDRPHGRLPQKFALLVDMPAEPRQSIAHGQRGSAVVQAATYVRGIHFTSVLLVIEIGRAFPLPVVRARLAC